MSSDQQVRLARVQTPQIKTASVVHLFSYERIAEADRSFSNGAKHVQMTPNWTTSVSIPDPEAAAKHAVLRGLSENQLWEHELPYLAMVLKLGQPRVDFIVNVKVTTEATTKRVEMGESGQPMIESLAASGVRTKVRS